jgi:hypothetical protein
MKQLFDMLMYASTQPHTSKTYLACALCAKQNIRRTKEQMYPLVAQRGQFGKTLKDFPSGARAVFHQPDVVD